MKLKGTHAFYDTQSLILQRIGVDIAENFISTADMQKLSEALLKNTTIKKLSLWCTKIGDLGAKYLAKVIRVHPGLEELLLCSGEFGDDGIIEIANALAENKTIKLVDIRYNQYPISYGPKAAKALGEMLKKNHTLQTLDMHVNNGTGIGDEGAKYLADGIKLNQGLKKLIVWYHKIGEPGVFALNNAMEINKTLTSLDLMGNPGVKTDVHIELQSKLEKNKKMEVQTLETSNEIIPTLQPEADPLYDFLLNYKNVASANKLIISNQTGKMAAQLPFFNLSGNGSQSSKQTLSLIDPPKTKKGIVRENLAQETPMENLTTIKEY